WDAYSTRIITDYVLPELEPTLLVFWHTDPDHTTHDRGFSAPETTRALRDADDNLGAILATYERLGSRQTTAVVVTSDHGGSTVTRRVRPAADLAGLLSEGAAAENGGSAFIYSADRAAVAAVRQLDYVGPVFTRDGRDGTFPMSLVGLDGPRAPDIVCSFAWQDEIVNGFAGTSVGTHGKLVVDHGTCSPYDIRNTLVAQAPEFRDGWADPVPVGNIDIAPTLAHLLRLDTGTPFDGRVLSEALLGAGEAPAWQTEAIDMAFSARGGDMVQRLKFDVVGENRYLASGWAESV
ncbi:MAG: alkaline phosphatase family protein, partial [Chloroflexi bacterium]|nr:alkaline phosphatase family protein [Chloroflexota bacterium]